MWLLLFFPSVNMTSGNMRIRRDSNQLPDISCSSNKGKYIFFQCLNTERKACSRSRCNKVNTYRGFHKVHGFYSEIVQSIDWSCWESWKYRFKNIQSIFPSETELDCLHGWSSDCKSLHIQQVTLKNELTKNSANLSTISRIGLCSARYHSWSPLVREIFLLQWIFLFGN